MSTSVDTCTARRRGSRSERFTRWLGALEGRLRTWTRSGGGFASDLGRPLTAGAPGGALAPNARGPQRAGSERNPRVRSTGRPSPASPYRPLGHTGLVPHFLHHERSAAGEWIVHATQVCGRCARGFMRGRGDRTDESRTGCWVYPRRTSPLANAVSHATNPFRLCVDVTVGGSDTRTRSTRAARSAARHPAAWEPPSGSRTRRPLAIEHAHGTEVGAADRFPRSSP